MGGGPPESENGGFYWPLSDDGNVNAALPDPHTSRTSSGETGVETGKICAAPLRKGLPLSDGGIINSAWPDHQSNRTSSKMAGAGTEEVGAAAVRGIFVASHPIVDGFGSGQEGTSHGLPVGVIHDGDDADLLTAEDGRDVSVSVGYVSAYEVEKQPLPQQVSQEMEVEVILDEDEVMRGIESLEVADEEFEVEPEARIAFHELQLVASTVLPEAAVTNQSEKSVAGAQPASGPILHRLMHLRADKLDLSFVEKVIIPPDELSNFCNELTLNPAARRDGKTMLDFNVLNNTSVHVVGLYGSKSALIRIFSDLGFASVVSFMQGGLDAAAGIYGFLHQGTLYIFYWHQGQRMQEASRKDVSCNFIRYVTDLCATVYICLDDYDVDVPLMAFSSCSSVPSKRQRTQRLQISVVRETENDLKLRKGFHKYPAVLQKTGSGNMDPVSAYSEQRVRLANGLHRCALVTSTVCPPSKIKIPQQKTVQIQEFAQLVGEWTASFNLDLKQLSHQEFSLFLKHSGLEGSQTLLSLRETFEARRNAQNGKFYEMEESLKEEEEKILSIFTGAQKAYLKLFHPWEECVLEVSKDMSVSSASEPTTADPTEGTGNEENMEVQGSTVAPSFDANDLLQAEAELAKIWTGDDGSQDAEDHPSFIFVGTEISFTDVNGARFRISDREEFVIASVPSATKTSAPILCRQEFVVRPKGVEPGRDIKVTCMASESQCPDGPVLTSRYTTVILGIRAPRKLKLMLAGPSASGMLGWMESYGRPIVPNIQQTFDHLAFGMANPLLYEDGISARVREAAKDTLESSNTLIEFKKRFSKEATVQLLGRREKVQRDGDVNLQIQENAGDKIDHEESQLLVRLCRKVYKEACAEFSSAIQAMVKKEISPMLMAKIQFQAARASNSLAHCLEKEESEFLTSLKEELSTGALQEHTLSVRRCSLQRRQSSSWRTIKSFFTGGSSEQETSDKLEVHYVSEQTETQRIIWTMSELVPMKKDVDDSMLNGQHLIIPQVSRDYNLIEIDPNSQRLSQVCAVKSGEVMVFVEDLKQPAMHLYVLPKLGQEIRAMNPIKTFRRGCDLVEVDEASRLVACYDKALSKISIFRIDETFRHCEWFGVDLLLSDYAGSKILTSMMFIPGKREIVLVDEGFKVRVFEISQPAMLRPRHIQLPGFASKMCVSTDGSCLMAFYKFLPDGSHAAELSSDQIVTQLEKDKHAEGVLKLEVYLLDESLCHLKTVILDYPIADIRSIDATVLALGAQVHLVLLDTSRPERGICTEILEMTLASEVCQLQQICKGRQAGNPSVINVEKDYDCPPLDYIYQIFEKYATSPPLIQKARHLHLHLILAGASTLKQESWKDRFVSYVNSSIDKLTRDKGKDFSQLKLKVSAGTVNDYIFQKSLLQSSDDRNVVSLGDWVRLLVCLVPIQVARAENNALRPLIDGLQISSNLNYADAVGLAEALQFGFYDSVLAQWSGNIKVISSMGKQSSGKSYLLNHLAGSLLDVAGGRCTDGVWMTMRASETCLYVLLDFEGLGSFERSEQEDMLLSILNAAVSNITIFNKKDFHLDKETEAVFERFQNGVSLVKQDSRLFKGLFYMAIKDVDASDVDDLKNEFFSKIQQICLKSQDNFLTKMYGGAVEIAAMPPFQRSEYHESIAEVATTVDELEPVHRNGSSLAVDLKLVIAQITAKDWSPIDSKRIALKLEILKRHIHTAITMGKLVSEAENVLLNFETQEEVADCPIEIDGLLFNLSDTDLELSPYKETQVVGNILQTLNAHFQGVQKRTGVDDELWHSTFEKFLMALADRRRQRILEWLGCNTTAFQEDGDVQKLRLEAIATLAEVKQRLSLCSSKCEVCFLRCVLDKAHPGKHTCKGKHYCSETCSFCLEEQTTGLLSNECRDLSGHEGPHNCGTRSHTCGKKCSLQNSSNCNVKCAMKPGHDGDHRCNTKQHVCAEKCSLSMCDNLCTIGIDCGDHDRHTCHERMCPKNCILEGCNRKCGVEDHFHSLNSTVHFCGSEHNCKERCEAQGICEIVTEVVKKSKTFVGKRSVFEYEHVSEQNGNRKGCCIPIPPWVARHEGKHRHTGNPNAVHFCTTRCPACGYFCNLPVGHAGLHDTTHGNMRDVNFVAESEDIDLVERKYAWGESGLAEMCMMHCKSQGRGHIHLVECLADTGTMGFCKEGLYEGARHQTRKYGPDKSVPKDEMSHAAYWKLLRFKDPCQEDDQKQFEMCSHYCRSDDHVSATGNNNSQVRSYCTEKLWHAPVSKTGLTSSAGYVTDDGHSFTCNHLRNAPSHVVFIIDRSGSMGTSDVKPTLAKYASKYNNRLGCVFEAIVRFIRTRVSAGQPDSVSIILFDTYGSILVDRQPMSEQCLDALLNCTVGGGTTYSSGLDNAQWVLTHASQDPSMQAKHPAVIFLSDGGNWGGTEPVAIVKNMKDLDHKLVFHTILFGRDGVDEEILKRMAAAGGGTYQVSIDEVQLARGFVDLARSLRPEVAALM